MRGRRSRSRAASAGLVTLLWSVTALAQTPPAGVPDTEPVETAPPPAVKADGDAKKPTPAARPTTPEKPPAVARKPAPGSAKRADAGAPPPAAETRAPPVTDEPPPPAPPAEFEAPPPPAEFEAPPPPAEIETPEPPPPPPAPVVPDAGLPDAAPAAPTLSDLFGGTVSDAPPAAPVSYHEDMAFQIAAPALQHDAISRARQASAALTAAIDAPAPAQPGAPIADVIVKEDVALVRVRGYVVTALYPFDARAAGFPNLESYAEQLETRLSEFVPAQRRRGSLQRTALHIFLSVFIGLITVVALRQLQRAFDRADEALDARRDKFDALTVLRVPVLSGEAVGGALAFLLDIGRVLTMVLTLGAAAVAILSQFDRTRPLLRRAATLGGESLLEAVQKVGGAIPSLALAALLVLAIHASLRVFFLLLEGVRSRRVVWNRLPPPRVPVFRIFVPWAAILVGAPLVVAAAFGRFGTPLELLAILAAGVTLLGTLPPIANWIAGGIILWRQVLHEGDWIEVRGVRGEVSIIGLTEITLVPEDGGSVHVPHLSLLTHPIHRMKGPPDQRLITMLERTVPVKALLEKVRHLVTAVDTEATVRLVEVGEGWVKLDIRASALRTNVREELWTALSDAVDRNELRIMPVNRHTGQP